MCGILWVFHAVAQKRLKRKTWPECVALLSNSRRYVEEICPKAETQFYNISNLKI
jgi:hypothetical protein